MEKTIEKARTTKMEVILLPLHGQGHLNPMLQFAKRLAFKGNGSIHISLATTLTTIQKITNSSGNNLDILTKNNIDFLSIYDDTQDSDLNFLARLKKFDSEASVGLGRLISTTRPSLVVYDGNLSWVVDVAKKHSVPTAAFFLQSCPFVATLYQMLQQNNDDDHDNDNDNDKNKKNGAVAAKPPSFLIVPSQEELTHGLHVSISSTNNSGKKQLHPIVKQMISHLINIHLADYILFNSFDPLDDELIKWMTTLWPSKVRTIGPTLPSAYLDKRIEYDVDYGCNLYKPNNEACMTWLNEQQVGSVMYVAFGSVASFSIEQMTEVAEALKKIPSKFLWVVNENEQKKLSDDFFTETSSKGLVLTWCPQLDVLAHDAVGCFLTHCGSNSIIESMAFGVPILGMPRFTDQVVNAHFVDQVWNVGIKVKADENRFVTCKEIMKGYHELMDGERGGKIKENIEKMKELVVQAVGPGGSSDKNIDEIINQLVPCKKFEHI